MTIDEFLAEIVADRDLAKWEKVSFRINAVLSSGYIRASDGSCPVIRIGQLHGLVSLARFDTKSVGRDLGLKDKDTLSLVNAADGEPGELHDSLLEACGL